MPNNHARLALPKSKINRLLNALFVPIVCCLIYFKLVDAFSIFNLNLILALLVLIYFFKHLAFHPESYHKLALGPIGIALILVFISELLIYWGSSYKANSYYAVIEILGLILFYYLIKFNTGDKRQLTSLLVGITIIGFLHTIGAMIRFNKSWLQLKSLGFDDLTYFKENLLYGDWVVNAFLLLPFPLILLIKNRDRIKWIILLVASILFVSIPVLLSFSRGAYIAALVFIILINAAILKYKLLRPKIQIVFNGAILCLIILISLPFISSVISTTTFFKTTSQTRSISSRKQIWNQTFKMAQNHPFLGVGSYNYSLGFMASAPRDDSMKFIRTPQNTYIGLAAEKGLVGLAAYAFVLAMVLYSTCSSLRLSKDNFDKIIVISLVTGLIATGTYFMTYYSALGNQGTAAMVITILACLDSIGKKETA